MPDLPTLDSPRLVDVVALIVIGLYVLEDLRRGVLAGLLDLAGVALALLAALLLYGPLSGWLVAETGLPYALAKPAAFGLVWVGSDLLLATTLRRVHARPAIAVARTTVGRLLGAFTGAARGAFVVALLMSVAVALPLPEPVGRSIRESRAGTILGERGEALERAISTVIGEAAQESLGLLTVKPESSERVTLRFTVASPRIDESVETRMLELVNRERVAAGLAELQPDATIREVARAYSVEMLQRGFFSHVDLDGRSPFDRMRRGGVRFSAAGENLALAPNVDVAHEGLMNSPGHRANILNGRFRRVGIGAADGGMHGKMFTQNFAD